MGIEPGKELAVMMGYESVNFDNSKGETCLEGGKKEARGGEWRVCSNGDCDSSVLARRRRSDAKFKNSSAPPKMISFERLRILLHSFSASNIR